MADPKANIFDRIHTSSARRRELGDNAPSLKGQAKRTAAIDAMPKQGPSFASTPVIPDTPSSVAPRSVSLGDASPAAPKKAAAPAKKAATPKKAVAPAVDKFKTTHGPLNIPMRTAANIERPASKANTRSGKTFDPSTLGKVAAGAGTLATMYAAGKGALKGFRATPGPIPAKLVGGAVGAAAGAVGAGGAKKVATTTAAKVAPKVAAATAAKVAPKAAAAGAKAAAPKASPRLLPTASKPAGSARSRLLSSTSAPKAASSTPRITPRVPTGKPVSNRAKLLSSTATPKPVIQTAGRASTAKPAITAPTRMTRGTNSPRQPTSGENKRVLEGYTSKRATKADPERATAAKAEMKAAHKGKDAVKGESKGFADKVALARSRGMQVSPRIAGAEIGKRIARPVSTKAKLRSSTSPTALGKTRPERTALEKVADRLKAKS